MSGDKAVTSEGILQNRKSQVEKAKDNLPAPVRGKEEEQEGEYEFVREGAKKQGLLLLNIK